MTPKSPTSAVAHVASRPLPPTPVPPTSSSGGVMRRNAGSGVIEVRWSKSTTPPADRSDTPGFVDLDLLAALTLRRQAAAEGRSMQEVVKNAVRDHLERADRRSRIDTVIDREVPRFREALDRLAE